MEHINKTIVINYDEATRMIDFCKTKEGVVSKEFFDWYLKDNPDLFAKSGMLIINNILKTNQRCAISFDASNPDKVIFTSYVYHDQSVICNWVFKRQENLTMEEVSFDINHLSLINLRKNDLLLSSSLDDMVKDAIKDADMGKLVRKGFRNESAKDLVQKTITRSLNKINKKNCESFIYHTYALLYYVSKQEPEEITSQFNKELDNEFGGQTVKSIYKYTGYINLRDNKTYKPIIKKSNNEPIREYDRHIQSWIVRGHYRNTKNGRIWIEPHIKGEGELEKRIYGTEEEKDLNFIPQVFEVTRTKSEKETFKKNKFEAIALESNEIIEKELAVVNKQEVKKTFIFFAKLKCAWDKIILYFSDKNFLKHKYKSNEKKY